MLNKNVFFANYSLIVRHVIVSGGSAFIEVSLFYLLYSVCSFALFVAHSMAFMCATSFGYIAHTYFTFKINILSYSRALKFLLQALLVMFVGFCLLTVFIELISPPVLAKLGQLSCTFLLNLIIGKFITFKK